jgi:hypothetical protein
MANEESETKHTIAGSARLWDGPQFDGLANEAVICRSQMASYGFSIPAVHGNNLTLPLAITVTLSVLMEAVWKWLLDGNILECLKSRICNKNSNVAQASAMGIASFIHSLCGL